MVGDTQQRPEINGRFQSDSESWQKGGGKEGEGKRKRAVRSHDDSGKVSIRSKIKQKHIFPKSGANRETVTRKQFL